MAEVDRRIDLTKLQAGPSGTLVVAPTMVETTRTGKDGKPETTSKDANPGKALLVELRAKMGVPRRRAVQEVPWEVGEGSGRRGLPWFKGLDSKGLMSEVRSVRDHAGARARGARQGEINDTEAAMRAAGKLKKPQELVPGRERRMRYMQARDEHGERTGITVVAEATRNPLQALAWMTPLSQGRRVAVFVDGSPSADPTKLDRTYDISDTDQHLRGRGWLKGFTADPLLKGIIEGDPNSTHVLGREKRKITPTTEDDVPAIAYQDSLKKRTRDAAKKKEQAEKAAAKEAEQAAKAALKDAKKRK